MGLSNEERNAKIYFSIYGLVRFANEYKENLNRRDRYADGNDEAKALIGYIDQLWPAVLGKQSNGGHWIFGSSSGNVVKNGDSSPWAMAICSHMDNAAGLADRLHRKNADPDNYDDCQERYEEERQEAEKNYQYNVFANHLNIYNLLGGSQAFVFRVYQYIEDIIYALRRYDDEFREQRATLDTIVSSMMGVCFQAFANSDKYAKAYCLERISELLYGVGYYYDTVARDVITAFLIRDSIHHHIKNGMSMDLPVLMNYHLDLMIAEKKKKVDFPQLRLRIALEIIGHEFHYDHQHRRLFKDLVEAGWADADVNKIREICLNNQKAHKAEEKSYTTPKSKYDDDDFSAYSRIDRIFGYKNYDDEPENENPAVEAVVEASIVAAAPPLAAPIVVGTDVPAPIVLADVASIMAEMDTND